MRSKSLPQKPRTRRIPSTLDCGYPPNLRISGKCNLTLCRSGSFKKLTGGFDFDTDTDRSSSSTNKIIQNGKFTFIIHKVHDLTMYGLYIRLIDQVPKCEISLHKGNSRLSEGCHQAILRLRAYRRFEDLMRFFNQYGKNSPSHGQKHEMTFTQGTIYAKRVVLGGRLIACRRSSDLSSSASMKKSEEFKKKCKRIAWDPGKLHRWGRVK